VGARAPKPAAIQPGVQPKFSRFRNRRRTHPFIPASGRRNRRRPITSDEEMKMHKIMLVAAALTAGAIGLKGTAAQQTQQQGSEGEMKVTGMVTEADQETNEISAKIEENQAQRVPLALGA